MAAENSRMYKPRQQADQIFFRYFPVAKNGVALFMFRKYGLKALINAAFTDSLSRHTCFLRILNSKKETNKTKQGPTQFTSK